MDMALFTKSDGTDWAASFRGVKHTKGKYDSELQLQFLTSTLFFDLVAGRGMVSFEYPNFGNAEPCQKAYWPSKSEA